MAYSVPGIVDVIAQPTSQVCWATVYTMMKSWKDAKNYEIRTAVQLVGAKYVELYNQNQVLPTSEFAPFISAAKMAYEPMQNKTIAAYETLLRNHGLLWVGTLFGKSPEQGLHSRIIQAINGDGTPTKTTFNIIDPAGGKRYVETFSVYIKKYEGAFASVDGPYYQIRHF